MTVNKVQSKRCRSVGGKKKAKFHLGQRPGCGQGGMSAHHLRFIGVVPPTRSTAFNTVL